MVFKGGPLRGRRTNEVMGVCPVTAPGSSSEGEETRLAPHAHTGGGGHVRAVSRQQPGGQEDSPCQELSGPAS